MTLPADIRAATDLHGAAPAGPAAGRAQHAQHIVGPWVDFLCLGGASLVLIPLAMAMPAAAVPAMVALMWMLADVLNHPHFAASYQIFYRDFRAKAFGDRLSPGMRMRYRIAGILLPVAMIAFFAAAFAAGNATALGWVGNAMLFLVGWHYTKQGYGMLMVDAVYKRRFFDATEKKVLLWNAYACWIVFWIAMNAHVSEHQMWGLSYYSIHFPDPVVWTAFAAAATTTAMSLAIFARRVAPGGAGLPSSGTMAYLVSLYFWAVARFNPLALMFVPAYHSLQYLTIVWRFERNRAADLAAEHGRPPEAARWTVLRFAAVAVALGALGFWVAPRMFDATVAYDTAALGPTAFMFMFWMFINIHHYFIDNVIWRRENPEAARYLFGARG